MRELVLPAEVVPIGHAEIERQQIGAFGEAIEHRIGGLARRTALALEQFDPGRVICIRSGCRAARHGRGKRGQACSPRWYFARDGQARLHGWLQISSRCDHESNGADKRKNCVQEDAIGLRVAA